MVIFIEYNGKKKRISKIEFNYLKEKNKKQKGGNIQIKNYLFSHYPKYKDFSYAKNDTEIKNNFSNNNSSTPIIKEIFGNKYNKIKNIIMSNKNKNNILLNLNKISNTSSISVGNEYIDTNLKFFHIDYYKHKNKKYIIDYNVSINLNKNDQNNFMYIFVKFKENVIINGETIIDKDDDELYNITSEDFILRTKMFCSFANTSDEAFEIITNKLKNNFEIFRKNISLTKYNVISDTYYKDKSSLNLFNPNKKKKLFDYKIHLSIKPKYLNEAIECFLNSDFYKYHINVFKIKFPDHRHYYEESNSKWTDFQGLLPNLESDFYLGIGYIVIYLQNEESLSNLNKFINYWKENFENNPDKYRKKNYIKFNVKLSETIYFGIGGDTSTKINNKKTKKHNHTNSNFLKDIFESYFIEYPNKNKIIKKYLIDTYSIDYDHNKLDDFEYWKGKNIQLKDFSNISMNYGFFPYKFENFNQKLTKN